MRVLPFVLAALALASLTGCTPPRTPDGELSVWSNGQANSMRMEGDRAWGPAIELKRFDGAYRGTVQGHVVDLHFTGDRVHGMVGAGRFDLHVSTEGGKVHGQGLVNGHISTFDVDGEAIEGSFGSCAYDMKRKNPETDEYVGYRSCAGNPVPASRVTIPAYIRDLPALDQATLYALLLTG